MLTPRKTARPRPSPIQLLESLEPRILLSEYFDWSGLADALTPDIPSYQPAVTQPTSYEPPYTPPTYYEPYTPPVIDYTTDQIDYTPVTPLYPPDSPTNLTARPTSDTSILLTWSQYSDADGFTISRRGPTGGWITIATLPYYTRAYTDFNLRPGTKYRYFVTAFNSDGSASSSTVTAATTGINPATGPVTIPIGICLTFIRQPSALPPAPITPPIHLSPLVDPHALVSIH